METRCFRVAPVKIGGGLRVPIPFDPDEAWGRRERHHVTGAVAGVKVRGELRRDERGAYLALGPAWVRDCRVAPGEDVEVALAPEGVQIQEMSPDLASAFAANPPARAFFESLPTFYRKNFLRWIEQAKRPETRARRIEEAIRLLAEGKRER